MKMKGKFIPMVSFQKLRAERKPDQKLVTRNWNDSVCLGWRRTTILTSKEISSTIENGTGYPLGDRMISTELMGNYCMDI